jgi:hypothetical protein
VCVTDLKRCWVIVPFVDHGGVTCDGSEGGNMSHSRRVYYIKPRLVNICFSGTRVHSGVCVRTFLRWGKSAVGGLRVEGVGRQNFRSGKESNYLFPRAATLGT